MSVYAGIKYAFIHVVFTQLFTLKFWFFVVGRFLFEQCDHQNQCNGSINANVCKGFGNKTLCYCNHGYLEFEGKCIHGTVMIWYFSRLYTNSFFLKRITYNLQNIHFKKYHHNQTKNFQKRMLINWSIPFNKLY